MTKDTKRTFSGIVLFIIGLVIGIAYINKFFPFDPSTTFGFAILAVWSMTGWVVSILFLLAGMCQIADV